MINLRCLIIYLLISAGLLVSCNKEEPITKLKILAITHDGLELKNATTGVSNTARIEILFDASLNLSLVNEHVSISPQVGFTTKLENASTKLVIDGVFDFSSSYTLFISSGALGQKGEVLPEDLSITFMIRDSGIIERMDPCLSTANCLQTARWNMDGNAVNFDFYANYPLFENAAIWKDIERAVIVIHGQGRNADEYYTWLSSTLTFQNLHKGTLLIAPYFSASSGGDPEQLFWSSDGWRNGSNSSNTVKMSSFSVIDSLVSRLQDAGHFPFLEKILVTGHSSGGLFTHLYAGANGMEKEVDNMTYMVANSQYFYYPDNRRWNEGSQTFTIPENCFGYDLWPMGYKTIPPYLTSVSKELYNDRFIKRNVIYLLGNGNQPDNQLNTTDCNATLLGTDRFDRGNKILQLLDTYYPEISGHSMVTVEGIGHDGQGMYSSSEFRQWLDQF